VAAFGGTCCWYWKEAGIAAVDSANPDFGARAKGGTIDFAVADMAAKPPRRLSVPMTTGSPSGFDAYASNYQWYWQAIGAVKIEPGNVPVWQLGDHMGSGVKIGIIDTGAPAEWSEYTYVDGWGYPTANTEYSLHPEFNEYDPAHPEDGGVVLLRDADGNVLNFDDYGHGTAVGSTLGAQHRGDGAMRGLAPRATLYFHRIDMNNWYSSALEGWYEAAEFGCQILNNSWLMIDFPVERFEDAVYKFPIIFRKAAVELYRRGVLIVAAASNDAVWWKKQGDTYLPWGDWGFYHGLPAIVLIPQDMPHVIVAGGTGPADYDPFAPNLTIYDPWPGNAKAGQKSVDFNLDRVVNAGPPAVGLGSAYGPFLTVMAPMGANIKDWSSPQGLFQLMFLASAWGEYTGQGRHDYWAGTSFSSPITCGVAALAAESYFSAHGVMPSPATLAAILKMSADDLVGPATDDFWVWNEKTLQFEFQTNVPADKPGKDMRYGYGRVNVKRAIELAQR
jgi:Subtilase family